MAGEALNHPQILPHPNRETREAIPAHAFPLSART